MPDDCIPNDLIESIQIVSDVPFTLDWARGTSEKVKLVRLTRIAETDAPGTQIHQTGAEVVEVEQEADAVAEESQSRHPEPPQYPPPDNLTWWQSSSSNSWSDTRSGRWSDQDWRTESDSRELKKTRPAMSVGKRVLNTQTGVSAIAGRLRGPSRQISEQFNSRCSHVLIQSDKFFLY